MYKFKEGDIVVCCIEGLHLFNKNDICICIKSETEFSGDDILVVKYGDYYLNKAKALYINYSAISSCFRLVGKQTKLSKLLFTSLSERKNG